MEAVPLQRKRKCCSRGQDGGQEITSKPSVQASSPAASYLIRTAARVLTRLTRPQESYFCSFPLCSAPTTMAGVITQGALPGTLFLQRAVQLPSLSPSGFISTSSYWRGLSRPFTGNNMSTTTTTNSTFLLMLFCPAFITVCCLLVQYYRSIRKSAASPPHP